MHEHEASTISMTSTSTLVPSYTILDSDVAPHFRDPAAVNNALRKFLGIEQQVQSASGSKAQEPRKTQTSVLILWTCLGGLLSYIYFAVVAVIPTYLAWSSKFGNQALCTLKWYKDSIPLALFGVLGIFGVKVASRSIDTILGRREWWKKLAD
jgi:hypothetical protein